MGTKEKNRKLTVAEQRRMERYEELCRELTGKGYRYAEMTVGLVAANIYAVILGIPFVVIGSYLFITFHRDNISFPSSGVSLLLSLVLLIVLTVVHELIHGLTWSRFTANHWKDIEFGFIKQYLTPYCVCTCPLSKWAYLCGCLAPFFVLGVLPVAAAIANGSVILLFIGFVMIIAAGGDLMIAMKILLHRTPAKEILYYDHPTQAGVVVFEKL